jgi:2',3'-cyclic-nucleotide 2'-phosphodiesterase (5'-nucleotidase family)
MSARNTILNFASVGLLLAGSAAAAQSPARVPEAGLRSVTLAYIADLHAQFETHPEFFWHGGKDEMTTAGGVARIAAAIQALRDDVLSDALREAAGTDIALSNGFRFSPPLLAGSIREADLWDWFPITTKLKVGKVSGRQLRAFWERETEHVFASDPMKLFGGWLPRPSGMTLRFAAHASDGHRVREVRIDGRLLEDDRLYTLVACEREGDDPDKLCRIPHVQEARVLSLDAHEAVRQYLAKHSPLKAPQNKRVVADDLPPVVRSQVLTLSH